MLWFLRKRSGFTLIELLVVILILAILMAIALPLYLRAVADSEKKTCRTNMQTIANAEQAYKVRSTAHEYVEVSGTPGTGGAPPSYTFLGAVSGDTITDFEGVTADLTRMPICPKGSAYVYTVTVAPIGGSSYTDINGVSQDVPEGGLMISCSYELGTLGTEHGYFAPGIDSQ